MDRNNKTIKNIYKNIMTSTRAIRQHAAHNTDDFVRKEITEDELQGKR